MEKEVQYVKYHITFAIDFPFGVFGDKKNKCLTMTFEDIEIFELGADNTIRNLVQHIGFIEAALEEEISS